MFKKYISYIVWFYTFLFTLRVFWDTQSDMLPKGSWVVTSKLDSAEWEDQLTLILTWIRDSIETLIPILAIGVFLFIGIRIALAKWNAEEFKKAWLQMIYAVVGIFVVGFAWAAVKLVSGLNI
jgi:hypothetical protein